MIVLFSFLEFTIIYFLDLLKMTKINIDMEMAFIEEDRKRHYCPLTPPTTPVKMFPNMPVMPPTPYLIRQILLAV